jgi:hypothetical protein
MLKKKGYTVFLQQRGGYLPSLCFLQVWRRRFLYASFLSLSPVCLLTVISWPWAYYDLVYLGPELIGFTSPVVLSGSLFLILFSFGMMFDFVISKRFVGRSILGW